MNSWLEVLDKFILQVQRADLKTSSYPKEWDGLNMRISFGMGVSARVPWIAFVAPDMAVSKGFYPVYLYYKDLGVLILAYGISETEEFGKSWPAEIMNSAETIAAYFDKDVPRYGDSFVFKSYTIKIDKSRVHYLRGSGGSVASEKDIEADLSTILDYYKKLVSLPASSGASEIKQGLFYMEKQLEDFLIQNWNKTELGKKYDLIVEDGELKSQQYKTDIGRIDILVRNKSAEGYVVIELKKDQSSDDTVGQLARYMGWVKSHLGENVRGVIIAGQQDKKLEYAIRMVPNTEIFIYEVNFRLRRAS